MKRYFFLFMMMIFLFMSFSCEHINLNNPEKQDCDPLVFVDTTRVYYQYYQDQKDTLSLVQFVVHTELDSNLTEDQIDSLFSTYGLRIAFQLLPYRDNSFLLFTPEGKHSEEFFTFYGQNVTCGFGNIDVVNYATPVFWTFPELPGDSSVTMLTDEFLVRIDTLTTPLNRLQELNAEYGVELVELVSSFQQIYLLRVTKRSQYSALDMANFYRESAIAVLASPNFVSLIDFYHKRR